MRRYGLITIIATVTGLVALSTPAAQAQGTGGEQPPAGMVSSAPASGTPHLKPTDDNPPSRSASSCSAATRCTPWALSRTSRGQHDLHPPQHLQLQRDQAVHGDELGARCGRHDGTTSDVSDTLNTIAFVNGNCADAYIGGKFTSVNGTTVAEHRRDRHHHRQRGHRVRQQGSGRGADPGRRGKSPAGRRQFHRHQR